MCNVLAVPNMSRYHTLRRGENIIDIRYNNIDEKKSTFEQARLGHIGRHNRKVSPGSVQVVLHLSFDRHCSRFVGEVYDLVEHAVPEDGGRGHVIQALSALHARPGLPNVDLPQIIKIHRKQNNRLDTSVGLSASVMVGGVAYIYVLKPRIDCVHTKYTWCILPLSHK